MQLNSHQIPNFRVIQIYSNIPPQTQGANILEAWVCNKLFFLFFWRWQQSMMVDGDDWRRSATVIGDVP
jgi:hypothetical protein